MSRRKAPLHDNNLLRKKDLGLTLKEPGLQDRWGRKDQPGRGQGHGVNSLVLPEAGRMRRRRMAIGKHWSSWLVGRAAVLEPGGLGSSPNPVRKFCDVTIITISALWPRFSHDD